jgi:catechol 2,3-dioxygenase-like lactoylglutathione lyase family enzyme
VLSEDPLSAFVPCADLDRCRPFYTDVLGLPLLADVAPFALEFRCAGTMLRLTRVPDLRPQPFTVAGWQVPELESELDELAGRGVRFERYDGLDQDGRAIWTAPGGARIAWFLDPDGNNLSLTQYPAERP